METKVDYAALLSDASNRVTQAIEAPKTPKDTIDAPKESLGDLGSPKDSVVIKQEVVVET